MPPLISPALCLLAFAAHEPGKNADKVYKEIDKLPPTALGSTYGSKLKFSGKKQHSFREGPLSATRDGMPPLSEAPHLSTKEGSCR